MAFSSGIPTRRLHNNVCLACIPSKSIAFPMSPPRVHWYSPLSRLRISATGPEELLVQGPDSDGCFGPFGGRLFPYSDMYVGRSSATVTHDIQECFSDWERNIKTTHSVMGSALGPHPYPVMVRDFQAVVGLETRNQA
ncbi:hypothetical protein LXL04_037477 [Taraxacum kok-saghyz]